MSGCKRSRLPRAAALVCLLFAAPAAAAETPAACPQHPMRVVRSVGQPTLYDGSFPGVPELCRIGPAGQQNYFYYGVWRSDWPGAGNAYPAIKTVINGRLGTKVAFVTRSDPGMQWTDTVANEGPEPLTIDGRTYRTLKLSHERQGIEGNTYHSIITVWHDIPTGAILKVVEDQISGLSYGPETTWTAIRVEPMPGR